jgi:hypothetical protein
MNPTFYKAFIEGVGRPQPSVVVFGHFPLEDCGYGRPFFR